MRTLTLYLATLVSMLGFATAAQSAVIIHFTSGGLSTISAVPSSTITVDIGIEVTGGTLLAAYQFSIQYSGVDTPTGLTNPRPSFDAISSWIPGAGGMGNGDPNDGVISRALAWQNTGAQPSNVNLGTGFFGFYLSNTVYHLDSVQFHVNGAGFVTGCLDCETGYADSFVDQTFTALTPVWNGLTIIPEPTTASLLGLGLLGLTVAGRRRS